MTDAVKLATEGPGAPPRVNGELVFDAPWQSRVFGITAALADDGRFDWPQFQSALIRHVPDHEDYWDAWLASLVDVMNSSGLVGKAALDARAGELFDRPAGHDH